MDAMIIGLDHGYAAIKGPHCTFPTGLVAYDYPPYTQKNVLEYGGRYYVVGTGRQPVQKDKTQTEDYYLLTLAAIARELTARNADHAAAVHLAAGLPLTDFGRDRESFRSYLLRGGRTTSYRYDGQNYQVAIQRVSLFPQGYAVALTRKELMTAPSMIVVDIGGWTVDMMRLDNKVPNAATCRSLETGVICCIDNIMEKARQNHGLSVTSAQIESVLRGETQSVPEPVVKLVCQMATDYVQNLFFTIAQNGLDLHAMPVIFMGGGASLIKRFSPEAETLFKPVILDDVSLNAKAYEQLAAFRQQGDSHG